MKRKDTDLKSSYVLTNYCFLLGFHETARDYRVSFPEPVALGPAGLWVSGNTEKFFDGMRGWVEKNFFSRKKVNKILLRLWKRMSLFARHDFRDYPDFLERYSGHEKSVAVMHVLDWSATRVAEEKDYFGLDQASFLLASNPPVTLTSQERARIFLAVKAGHDDEWIGREFGWMRRPGEEVRKLALEPGEVKKNALKNQEFFEALPLSRKERDFLMNMQLLRYLDSGYHKHSITGRLGAKRVLQKTGEKLGIDRRDVVNLLPEEVMQARIPEDMSYRRQGEYVVYKPGEDNLVSVITRRSGEWKKFSREE